MTSARITEQIATLLRQQRAERGLTQQALAAAAGVSHATVTHVERGRREASLPMVERLFAALDLQVRLVVEPVDADLDTQIQQLATVPLDQRLADSAIPMVAAALATAEFSHVVEGAAAALVQGVPFPAPTVDIAVRWADADSFTAWLVANWARRWDSNWRDWGFQSPDPRIEGAYRWQLRKFREVEIRARMCDELPESLAVQHGEIGCRVRPLAELEIADHHLAQLLRRYREQARG